MKWMTNKKSILIWLRTLSSSSAAEFFPSALSSGLSRFDRLLGCLTTCRYLLSMKLNPLTGFAIDDVKLGIWGILLLKNCGCCGLYELRTGRNPGIKFCDGETVGIGIGFAGGNGCWAGTCGTGIVGWRRVTPFFTIWRCEPGLIFTCNKICQVRCLEMFLFFYSFWFFFFCFAGKSRKWWKSFWFYVLKSLLKKQKETKKRTNKQTGISRNWTKKVTKNELKNSESHSWLELMCSAIKKLFNWLLLS